jgi:hypothetical protein
LARESDDVQVSDKVPPQLAATMFRPGKSGNPGGRSKGHERKLRECVDGMTAADPCAADGEEPRQIPAWEAVVKRAVLDAVAGDRYARDFIADRLMGKPKQTVTFEDTDDNPDEDAAIEALSLDEVRVLAKVRAATVQGPRDGNGVH